MLNLTTGPARELINLEEFNLNKSKGTVITDDRRRRPLWFDGRFLDANALNSEQNYILARQADISRVAGIGVVHGLNVDRLENKSRSVSITAGHGITSAGELVIIPDELNVDLADIPEIQKLDARFGISIIPKQASRNRSGLYILALRPVEYTDGPLASYPTSINAARSVEDGNIVEATAVTLIPYQDHGTRVGLNQRRKHVAREIFLQDSKKGQATGVLPLAMLALNLGVIQWLDTYMVRREVGARDHDIFGLGLSPRALREAYLRQYQNQLAQILTEDNAGNPHIIASDHFLSLPAAGSMPASSIDVDDFTQSYFPSEMDVDLSLIPEDELDALIEDSYSLPPIDLTLSSEEFESTSILIVIPVPRSQLRQLSLGLNTLIRPLQAAAPGLVSKRKPITALTNLNIRRLLQVRPNSVNPNENQWRQILQGVETLWFIRRRNISYKDEVVSDPVSVSRDEVVIEDEVTERFRDLQLVTMVNNINNRGTTAAEGEVINLFSSPVMLNGSEIAVRAAVKEISKIDTKPTNPDNDLIDRASVIRVSSRFTQPDFGEGLSRLEKADPNFGTNKKIIDGLVDSGKVPELDKLAREFTPVEFEKFAKELAETASSEGTAQPAEVAKFIDETLLTLDRKSLIKISDKQRVNLGANRITGVTTLRRI